MSQNYINLLPTELLCQVFECLDLGTRQTVAEVCTRWSDILWHFGQPDDFDCETVKPKLLMARGQTRELQRFRSVQIDGYNFQTAAHVQLLEKYVYNESQVENLLQMDIKVDKESWNNVFGKERDLRLPNLRVLRVRCLLDSNEQLVTRCRIIAPKLHTFRQDGRMMRDLLLTFSSQIQTLMVMNCNKGDLFSTLGVPFPNLRSLVLKVSKGLQLQEADCTLELKALVENLDHLKIIDWKRVLAPGLSFIIPAASKLKSLKIYAPELNVEAYNQLNKLKQLEELTLMAYVTSFYPHQALNLPVLTKLTMFAGNSFPMDSVPSIRTLALGYDHHLYGISRTYITWIYFYRNVQLETLELFNILLHDPCVAEICDELPNISVLKLKNVEVEYGLVWSLMDELKNLKLVRFSNCQLADSIGWCQLTDDCSCSHCDDGDDLEDEALERQASAKRQYFFADLVEENEDRAIAVSGGNFMWRFHSSHHSLYRALSPQRSVPLMGRR